MTTKLQEEIQAAAAASDILENNAFMSCVEDTRAHLMSGWYHTQPSQGLERQQIWDRLKALDTVLDILKERIDTGKLAKLEFEQAKQKE